MELKHKKITARLNEVVGKSYPHGDRLETGMVIALEFGADPAILGQLSGDDVDWNFLWKENSPTVTGLKPLAFATEFTFQKMTLLILSKKHVVPSCTIDTFVCKPMELGMVRVTCKCRFECSETLVAHLVAQLKRQGGVGVTFQGLNATAEKASEDQEQLELEDNKDGDNVTKLPGADNA